MPGKAKGKPIVFKCERWFYEAIVRGAKRRKMGVASFITMSLMKYLGKRKGG